MSQCKINVGNTEKCDILFGSKTSHIYRRPEMKFARTKENLCYEAA
jgi:hypothetical protein